MAASASVCPNISGQYANMSDLYLSFLQPSDVRRALELDAEDEAQAEADQLAEARRVQAEAEEAAEARAEAAAAEFATMEPPAAIAAVTNGLSPQRARLVRYVQWLATLEAEHASLISGRAAYLTAQKVPTLTKQAIEKLISDDKSGLVELMTQGGRGVTTHSLRAHERKLLQDRLAGDEHAAEVATSALTEVEGRTDALAKQIEILRGRRRRFVADCVQEHLVQTAGPQLIAQVEALRSSLKTTLGAFGALQQLRDISHYPRQVTIELPTPRLPGEAWHTGDAGHPGYGVGLASGYTIGVEVHEQLVEQRKWMSRAEKLIADPHADIADPS